MWLDVGAAVLTGAIASMALTQAVKPLASRLGAVALPKADRWHRQQVPLLGGVAIMASVCTGLAVFGLWDREVLTVLGAATVLGLVGLWDDLRPLKPQNKLVLQILVASAMTLAGLQLSVTGYAAGDVLLTIGWVVGITNAVNLLDNMDGLAAGVVAVAVAFRLVFFASDGDVAGAQFSGVLLGALLGFLVYNFNPASIFMGDAGSLFLGALVSGLSLVGTWSYLRGTASVLVIPVLLLLVPIFDTTLVTLARIRAGRPVSVGGRDHASHRLVALGLSERRAVATLYLFAALAGALGWVSYRFGLAYAIVLIGGFGTAVLLFGVFLGRIRVYPDEQAAPADSPLVRLATSITYKRQLAAVVLDSVLIVLAYYAAYLLRFETAASTQWERFVTSLPIVLAVQVGTLWAMGAYRPVWRHIGIRDIIRLVQAVALGAVASVVALQLAFSLADYSRALFAIHAVTLTLAVVAARMSFRALDEMFRPELADAVPVILYGAGERGLMVLRETRRNPQLGRRVVAFLDDDASKQHKRIGGISVHAPDQLECLVQSLGAQELVIAAGTVASEVLAHLRRRAADLQIALVQASLEFTRLDR